MIMQTYIGTVAHWQAPPARIHSAGDMERLLSAQLPIKADSIREQS